MAGRRILTVCMLAALILTTPAAYAQDKAREKALTAGAKIDAKKVEAAAKKGCDWLRGKQTDGKWQPTEQQCRDWL